jgi:hypothetical protein
VQQGHVVLHIKYTAREGGVALRDAAVDSLNRQLKDEQGNPQARLFSLQHEFPTEWHRLRTKADQAGNHSQSFSLPKERFPFLFQGGQIHITSIEIFGVPKTRATDAPTPELKMSLSGPTGAPVLQLETADPVAKLAHKAVENLDIEVKDTGATEGETEWTINVLRDNVNVSLDRLDDVLLLFHFTVTMPQTH